MDKYDIAIIGAGPAGYVAALRAAQLGFRVACIDKRQTQGGTCLNEGCIPSKVLLHLSHKYASLQQWKEWGIEIKNPKLNLKTVMHHKDTVVAQLCSGIQTLFEKNKITFYQAEAQFVDHYTLSLSTHKKIQAAHIIIATGSESIALPFLSFDEKTILSSRGILILNKAPESLAVIGGGVIGLELGSVWQRFGSQVTIIEAQNRIISNFDDDVVNVLQKSLEKEGMKFLTNTKIQDATSKTNQVQLKIVQENTQKKITFKKVLVAVGRKPFTERLNLDAVGIQLDEKGRIPVNKDHQTIVPHIYAIGDVIAGPMLAHKASEEAINLVERLSGRKVWANPNIIPEVIYTHPEVASVGQNEQRLKAQNINYKIGKFSLKANSRAKTYQEAEGFVKILTDAQTDRILGASIVAAQASTMIGEIAIAMEMGASAEDIARTCHAHPTFNEAIKEAAWAAFDKPLHSL